MPKSSMEMSTPSLSISWITRSARAGSSIMALSVISSSSEAADTPESCQQLPQPRGKGGVLQQARGQVHGDAHVHATVAPARGSAPARRAASTR